MVIRVLRSCKQQGITNSVFTVQTKPLLFPERENLLYSCICVIHDSL